MDARGTLRVGSESFEIFRLDALQDRWDVARLPYSLRVLLENALRAGSDADTEAIAGWVATDEPSREISFRPSRVIHQDHRRSGDRRLRSDAERDAGSRRQRRDINR
jgi:aconitate hydratase